MSAIEEQLLEVLNKEVERRERLERCEHSFEDFCLEYFGNSTRMQDAIPDLHKELRELASNQELEEWWWTDTVTGRRIKKKGLVVAAPRGHAKTMILTFFLSLWWALFKKKSFIILVGSSALAAAENVTDIREELESNELIRGDFGDLCGACYGFKWAQSDIVIAHSDPVTKEVTHTCRITAKSPGARIRGIKHRGVRPDAILIDDVESDEIVRNPDTIAKIAAWINGAAIPALDPKRSDLIVVGTILHFDSVLARMLSPRFKDIYVQRVYRAYWDTREGIRQYLWPERFSADTLEMERKRMGTLAFNAEYLNNPVDPETRRFRPEWIRWYTRDDISFKKGRWYYRDQPLEILQAVDPAVKERDQDNNDYFSHITIGVTEESNITKRTIVVLWPFQDRLDFPEQVQMVIKQANAYPMVERIGIESVAYQVALRQQILLQETLPLREIKHDKGKADKKARITAMSVFFENAQILLRAADDSEAGELDELQQVRVHHAFAELYTSLMRYPLIIHDDLLDTLEMCVSMAKRSRAFEDFRVDVPQDPSEDVKEHPFGIIGEAGLGLTGRPPFLDSWNQPLAPYQVGEQKISGW